MKKNKGFTLAEMLIVVAIIGVLIAILVPSFTTQLEKSRETTDAANIRSAIGEAVSAALTGDDDNMTQTVVCTQKTDNWQYITEISGYAVTLDGLSGAGKDVTITVTADETGAVTFSAA